MQLSIFIELIETEGEEGGRVKEIEQIQDEFVEFSLLLSKTFYKNDRSL